LHGSLSLAAALGDADRTSLPFDGCESELQAQAKVPAFGALSIAEQEAAPISQHEMWM